MQLLPNFHHELQQVIFYCSTIISTPRNILPDTSRPSISSSFANRIPIVKCKGISIPAVHAAEKPLKKSYLAF